MGFSPDQLKRKLRKWGLEGFGGQPLRALVLFHRGEKESVESWKIDGQEEDALAAEIESAVREDLGGMDGTQYYHLRAYFGDAGSNPSAHLAGAIFKFDIVGELSNDVSDEGGSDKPTPSGFLTQTMRMREVEHRQHHRGVNDLVEGQRELIEDLKGMVNSAFSAVQKALDQQIEATRVMTDMREQTHRHDMERRDVESSNRMKESFMDSAQLVFPAVINRFMLKEGEKPPKAKINPFVEELDALRKVFLQPEFAERIPAILAALDTFQGPFLMGFAQKLKDDEVSDIDIAALQMFFQKMRQPTYRKLCMAIADDNVIAIIDSMLMKIMPPEEEPEEVPVEPPAPAANTNSKARS